MYQSWLGFFSVIRDFFFSFYYQLKFRQRQKIPNCGHITLSVYHQIAVRGRKSPLMCYCWSSYNCLWLHINQRIMWYRTFSLPEVFFPPNLLLHVCIIFAKVWGILLVTGKETSINKNYRYYLNIRKSFITALGQLFLKGYTAHCKASHSCFASEVGSVCCVRFNKMRGPNDSLDRLKINVTVYQHINVA